MTGHADRPVTLRLHASFEAGALAAPLEFWWQATGLDVTTVLTPYAQVIPGLLNAAVGERHLVLLRWEDLLRHTPGRLDTQRRPVLLQRRLAEYLAAVDSVFDRTGRGVVTVVCPPSVDDAETTGPLSHALARAAAGTYGSAVVDVTAALGGYGGNPVHDPQADALAHIPYRPEFFPVLAGIVARAVTAPANNRPDLATDLPTAASVGGPDLLNAIGAGRLHLWCDEAAGPRVTNVPALRALSDLGRLHVHHPPASDAGDALAWLLDSKAAAADSTVVVAADVGERDRLRERCPDVLSTTVDSATANLVGPLWSTEMPGVTRGPDADPDATMRIGTDRLNAIHDGLGRTDQIRLAYRAWRRRTRKGG